MSAGQKETDREFANRMVEVMQRAWHGNDTDEIVTSDIKLGDLRRLVLAFSMTVYDEQHELDSLKERVATGVLKEIEAYTVRKELQAAAARRKREAATH